MKQTGSKNVCMRTVKMMSVFLLAAVLCLGISKVSVKADATKTADKSVIYLKPGKTYKKYDFTGDGKKDKFKYIQYRNKYGGGGAKIYLNGKYKKKIDLIRGGWLYRCKGEKKKVYLIPVHNQMGGADYCSAYMYKKGNFRICHRDFSDYGFRTMMPYKTRKNVLYMKSTGQKLWAFDQDSREPYCYLRYKMKNGKFTLISPFASVKGTYTAGTSFKTNSSPYRDDGKGISVPEGSRVILKRVWFSGNYDTRMELSVNGETGWFDPYDSETVSLYQ